MQTGFVEVNGARLHYDIAGSGHPLVLIHAGVADRHMWDAEMSSFAPHFRVIRYDTRGFGESVTEDVQFSNRQDLADLLDHLKVEQAHLIGVSRGGQIAMDFTLEHPERVSALILCGSGPGGFEAERPAPALETQMFEEMEAAWERKEFERLTELELRMWLDGPGQPAGRVDPRVREKVRAMILNNYRTHTVEGRPVRLDPPAASRLNEIRVPALIIVGELDTSHIRAAAAFMEHQIANVRTAALPAAHLANLERPDEFREIVLRFLREIARPA